MGGAPSRFAQLIEVERLNWAKSHSLDIDVNLRKEQLPLLERFNRRLELCSQRRRIMNFGYIHYFVTDGTWFIEFGGGEELDTCVLVHNNPKTNYHLEKVREMTPEIKARMREVCGARGYSLCLRNCEHLAKYILTGSWVSMQTCRGTSMASKIMTYMMAAHTLNINEFPLELRDQQRIQPLYRNQRAFLTYQNKPEALDLSDHNAFNVLVVGPTGCGKSRLINLLFNQTVCKSVGRASSVTKHVQFVSGNGTISGQRRRVNVIDTIGFCDTTLSKDEVYHLIQDKVRANVVYLDKVVIVCSGRIENIHVECLQQVMKWLEYGEYKYNFVFLYNKADQIKEAEREKALGEMCGLLGASETYVASHPDFYVNWLPSVVLAGEDFGDRRVQVGGHFKLACGFPEGGSYADIEGDLKELVDALFVEEEAGDRIPAEKSWCSIL